MKKSWKRVFERRSRGAECVSGGCDSDSCVAPDGLIWTETPMPWAPRIIFQIISINYVSINFLKAWQMLSSAAVWSLIVIVIMWWHAQQRLQASRPEGPNTSVTWMHRLRKRFNNWGCPLPAGHSSAPWGGWTAWQVSTVIIGWISPVFWTLWTFYGEKALIFINLSCGFNTCPNKQTDQDDAT